MVADHAVDGLRRGHLGFVGVDHHDGVQQRELGHDREHTIDELRLGDEHGNIGEVEDVVQHASDVRGVERHLDRPEPTERDHRAVRLEPVGEHGAHVRALTHADAAERRSPPAGLRVEFGVGQRSAVDVVQRDDLGSLRGIVRDGVGRQATRVEHDLLQKCGVRWGGVARLFRGGA